MRILIVEDDPAIRELYRYQLEDEEHEILEAACGAEAEWRLAQGGIEAVVTDGTMPWGRGSHTAGPWGYVILCTARSLGIPAGLISGDVELVELARANGFPAGLKGEADITALVAGMVPVVAAR